MSFGFRPAVGRARARRHTAQRFMFFHSTGVPRRAADRQTTVGRKAVTNGRTMVGVARNAPTRALALARTLALDLALALSLTLTLTRRTAH